MSKSESERKLAPEHPYLTGNFAPVSVTHSATPCTYTGLIPPELLGGQYIRNGGNPITNNELKREYHWFDGDGMLAGVFFRRSKSDPGAVKPIFSNQYILTDLCLFALQNKYLRRPILPSIATLVNPASTIFWILFAILRTILLVFLSNVPGSQNAIKRISVANTGIHFHDGRALATCESGPPIRIHLPSLRTIGWFDGSKAKEEQPTKDAQSIETSFGGTGLFSSMREWSTGHPKVDPRTGEMILFHCNFMAPYVHYSVLPDTQLTFHDPVVPRLINAPVPGCSGGKMMHDFGVSLGHTVILDLPLTLTPFNLLKNKPVVEYEPHKPSRFGVFPRRRPEHVRWFETVGCCIFHTANTWDQLDFNGNAIAVNMLVCRLTSATTVYTAGNIPLPPPHLPPRAPECEDRTSISKKDSVHSSEYTASSTSEDDQCRLYYYRFPLQPIANEISHQYALSAIPFEFPTLNPAYEMSSAKYIYGCSTTNPSFSGALGKATKIDVLVKIDVGTLLLRAEHERPDNITGCVDTRTVTEVLSSDSEDDPIRAFQMPERCYAQEARFVSREKPIGEDDGWLLFYVFDETQLDEDGECMPDAVSELWILDARNMRDVVARVTLPQRVPYGLHGNWFSEEQIGSQRGVDRMRGAYVGPEGIWARRVKKFVGWALG